MKQRIYFIKPVGMEGPIKIGTSCSPEKRRSALANWSPFPLEIIAEIRGDNVMERRFHARFMHCHERREWFTATPELLATIEAINAGTFDQGSLPPPRALRAGLPRRKRTQEERLEQSYRLRLSHMAKRSGFVFRGRSWCVVRYDETAAADDYLAAPHVHGQPLNSPEGPALRSAWLASVKVAA